LRSTHLSIKKTNLFKTTLLICICLVISITGFTQQKRFSFNELKMGSPFTIIFYSDDSAKAARLASRCFKLVDSLVLIYSDYIDSSELCRLSATSGPDALPVKVSPALLDILVLSHIAFEKSNGAFDITIGPLVKVWRKARKTKEFPDSEAVKAARSHVGFNNLLIDTVNKTVRLLKPGMQLDLGGIAQGYMAQKTIDLLQSEGVKQALVNVSGDIVVSGAPPGTKGWLVGINVPELADELIPRKLLLHNKSVTTSGDVYQFLEHAGKKYSHIIDPRSGYGITSQRNVTAIANDGTTADWLATACSILTIKQAKKLAAQMDAEVLVGQIKKGKLVFSATKGFKRYWKGQKL